MKKPFKRFIIKTKIENDGMINLSSIVKNRRTRKILDKLNNPKKPEKKI